MVVIEAENHSFDNILGFWCDANPGRCPAGGMPPSVTLSNGAVVTPVTDSDKVPNVVHNVKSQQAAIDGGTMDGWQNISGCGASTGYQCISGYQPSQVPNLTRLAGSFTIGDDMFSMADAPSWGGHIDAVSATLDHFLGNNPFVKQGTNPGIGSGRGWGCDSGLYATWIGAEGRHPERPVVHPGLLAGPGPVPLWWGVRADAGGERSHHHGPAEFGWPALEDLCANKRPERLRLVDLSDVRRVPGHQPGQQSGTVVEFPRPTLRPVRWPRSAW